ncbi:MAG: FKBP-type peptidyl-prolyl cis-trans isomerase [Polyangiaceae bacterium]
MNTSGPAAASVTPSVMPPPPAEGAFFAGDYRLIQLLSKSEYSALYLADQVSRGTRCIIEQLFAPVVPGKAFRDRFAEQALLGSRVASPQAAVAFASGVDEASSVPWLAFESFVGEDLATAITRRGPLPPAHVGAVLAQVAGVLAIAHASGVVHGALRPESIVLTDQSRSVKVLNFGVSKILANAKRAVAPSAPAADPLWASPEQCAAAPVDLTSDVWSLGLLAFFLLTGHRFWRAEKNGVLLREVTTDPLHLATARAHELGCVDRLPHGFNVWFSRCVSRDAASRFGHAGEAIAALDQTLRGGGETVTGSITPLTFPQNQPPQYQPPMSGGRGIFIALAAVIGIAVMGGGGFFGLRAARAYKARQAATISVAAKAPTTTTDSAAPAPEAAPAAPSDGIPVVALEDLPRTGAKGAAKPATGTAAPAAAAPAAPSTTTAGASTGSTTPTTPAASATPAVTAPTRLVSVELASGKGAAAKSGDTISVNYVAKVEGGAEYDAKHKNSPFSFTLGKGSVTKGWEQGIPGMKVGGKRKLTVPPNLAYGEKGLAPNVPPNATLVFEIELVSIGAD